MTELLELGEVTVDPDALGGNLLAVQMHIAGLLAAIRTEADRNRVYGIAGGLGLEEHEVRLLHLSVVVRPMEG